MPDDTRPRITTTASHWGTYEIETVEGRITGVKPAAEDPDPSAIGQSFRDAVQHEVRVRAPMVREGYLAKGPGHGEGRGREAFVEIGWDEALDLVARELKRVRDRHGNESIFAGSYGWASAGRFHHAQSQLRRFLNLYGGNVYHRNSYSLGAAHVLLPHIAASMFELFETHTPWDVIAEHGQLVVAFGGLALKNAQVNAGGVGRHTAFSSMKRAHAKGVHFVNISPVAEDIPPELEPEWLAAIPNSDTALMMGLAHTLVSEGLHDRGFLARCCVGWERFEPYLTGGVDGVAKSADWAAALCGLPADTIRDLARRMARSRTVVTVAWALQRADHGEQPFWMALTLACMLGQIGLPGGGVGFGYNAVHGIGADFQEVPWASLPQGENPVQRFIPVARIADMLLNPGASYDYDGQRLTYPDIRLVYWVGGNPFHHHQDLNRLVTAWRRPETIIVHEPWWTPVARHADIVLPATTTLERNDLALARQDSTMVAMKRAISPVGAARSEFDIFSGVATRLGFAERFTEGRNEMDWLRHLYDVSRQRASREGVEMPDFDSFWELGRMTLERKGPVKVMFSAFRSDPEKNRLTTPSGKLEIFSERIAGFGYDDCPGHPVWRPAKEWLGAPLAARFPLHLVSNQPRTRLHSQLDPGCTSRASKIRDREPARLHPTEAAARGIADGDVIRVFNDRGACLAGVIVTDTVRPGILQLSTGAWFDPAPPGELGTLERHGNPNVLTRDEGCSKLSQGSVAHSTLVQVERFEGPLPAVRSFEPPPIRRR
ncbi:MAG: molybdopterin-dependent oxidoreductase [Alphaproteobacteria bacterium]|nr:molybdopterin-dependent oxidoreductase [Alphaproteobacteria bacterium]